MPAIARLARLCPAGDALCWIKAVYSKLKGWRVSGLLGTPEAHMLEAAYRGGLSHFKSHGI
jgi:hypothetical protein